MIYKVLKRTKLFFLFGFFTFLTGCITPESNIIESHVSAKASSYKINSIVLLPLEKDDTTDTGTFYSTNHFLNALKENYPPKSIDVLEIDKIIGTDSLAVKKIIESIRKNGKLDIENFFSTDLGSLLTQKNPDAMILGTINNSTKNIHFWLDTSMLLNCRWTIECDFVYYLISLKDGEVLWMSNVLGVANYEEEVSSSFESDWKLYPPLDIAITNGIDKIFNTLPFKKDTTQYFY